MMRRLLLLLALFLSTSSYLFSQQGSLQGKIFDKTTNESLAFASVIIESGGKNYGGTTSDENGKYKIAAIPPGTYDVKASYMGYHPYVMKGVSIQADAIRFLNIDMTSLNIQLKEIEITWKPPLIDKGNTSSQVTMTSEQIEKLPSRSADAVAATVAGVFTDENGNIGGIRGQRSSGNVTYIDGVRVIGSGSLPQSALDQVTVITGGLPAQYGDATGGVINITTKGPSRHFGFGAQYQTNELIDRSHSNLLGLSLTGPLFIGKDTTQNTSLLGFFIAGELSSGMAGRTALDEYTVNDELKSYLKENPLRI
jgi:hypothetical protein